MDALVKAVAGGLVAFLLRLGGGVLGLGGVGLGKGVLPLDVVGQVLVLRQFGFQAAVLLGGGGLGVQFFHLAGKLGLQVGEALQVVARVA